MLSAALIVAKVTGYFLASANIGEVVKKAIEQSKPADKNVTAQVAKSRKVADALKRQNLFSPPAPKRHPVNAVMGILGDDALINGKWYKAGAKVADAKILAVGPTSVTVEWEGKTKVFSPIDGGSSSGSGGPSRPGKSTASSRGSGSSSGGPQMVVTKSSTGAGLRMGGDPGGMREMYEIVSETQREKLRREMEKTREKYMRMSETERAKFRVEMLEKLRRERLK